MEISLNINGNHILAMCLYIALMSIALFFQATKVENETESSLASTDKFQLHMHEAEIDSLNTRLSEVSELNIKLTKEKRDAEWKSFTLENDVKTERRNVQSLKSELSSSRKEVEHLRQEKSRADRRIDQLQYKIDHDPRNGCKCLCSDFDAARFCGANLYWMLTHYVRLLPFSNFVLGLLDKLVSYIEPNVHLLE